jgi:hypothetical protein
MPPVAPSSERGCRNEYLGENSQVKRQPTLYPPARTNIHRSASAARRVGLRPRGPVAGRPFVFALATRLVGSSARNGLDPRRVAGFDQELHQVVARDRGRHGVDQRVGVDRAVRHQGGVEHHHDPAVAVVDRAERCHRAGLDAERLAHEFGRAERKPAAGAEPPVQRLQLDRGVLQRGDEIKRALLVLEEQVLGVAAGDRAAQRLRLLDGEQRRMAHRGVGDAEAVEGGEQLVGGRGHGLKLANLGRGCKAPPLFAIGTACGGLTAAAQRMRV